MTAVRIDCTNKSDRLSLHERIRNVGGPNADGTRWHLSQEVAIVGVEEGRWQFFVERPAGDRAQVVVARSAYGNKFLKATADGDLPNNLLALPECRT